jgi:hypothetical protein
LAGLTGLRSAPNKNFIGIKILYCPLLLPSNLFFNSLNFEKQYTPSSVSAFFDQLHPKNGETCIAGFGKQSAIPAGQLQG